MRGTHGWGEISQDQKRELIAAIVSGKPTAGPLHIELDVTDRCNVACYFCNAQDVRTRDQLSLEHVTRVVDELVQTGLRSVRLAGGGDPVMHKQAGQILDHLEKRGIVLDNVTTNGALLGPEIAERLVRMKAREVIFSLNAADAADYHRMMRVPAEIFDRVVGNIRYLADLRKGGEYPSIVIQFLLDRFNYMELPRMYELGRSLNPDRLAMNLVLGIPLERIEPTMILRPEEGELMRPGLERIFAADRDAGHLQIAFPYQDWNAMMLEIKGQLGYPERPPLFSTASTFQDKNGHCFFGWYTATVSGSGSMYPCCLLMMPDFKPLGNVTEGSFRDQWNGPGFTQMRREMRDVFLSEAPSYTSERFKVLRRQCVEPHMCWLKNMYFRGDESFYRELGEALEKARFRYRLVSRVRRAGRKALTVGGRVRRRAGRLLKKIVGAPAHPAS